MDKVAPLLAEWSTLYAHEASFMAEITPAAQAIAQINEAVRSPIYRRQIYLL